MRSLSHFGSGRGFAIALAATALVACSTDTSDEGTAEVGTPQPAALESVQEQVEIYEGTIPGALVLLRDGDKTAVVTMGDADVAHQIAVDAEQTFAIASLTKPIVATVVLQLVGEGLLSLDDDVHQWLPELRRVRSAITVEQLLSHRSGLRDVTQEDVDRVGREHAVLLKAVAADPLQFDPGTDGSYANVNYGALGLIVERLLDQPLGEVLQERVFAPAGMSSSSLGGEPDVHDYVAGEDVTARNDLDLFWAAGGVVSTVGDLDAFYRALWSGELLDQSQVDEMRTPRGTLAPYGNAYGLGLDHREVKCGEVIGHDGELDGILTGAWTLEDDDQRFVALMLNDNSSPGSRFSLVEAALCS